MEMHAAGEKESGFIANKVLDVLIQHTVYSLYQAMMFMSDKAQDELVAQITEQKAKIQAVRIKSDGS